MFLFAKAMHSVGCLPQAISYAEQALVIFESIESGHSSEIRETLRLWLNQFEDVNGPIAELLTTRVENLDGV